MFGVLFMPSLVLLGVSFAVLSAASSMLFVPVLTVVSMLYGVYGVFVVLVRTTLACRSWRRRG